MTKTFFEGRNYSVSVFDGDDLVSDGKLAGRKGEMSRAQIQGWALGREASSASSIGRQKRGH